MRLFATALAAVAAAAVSAAATAQPTSQPIPTPETSIAGNSSTAPAPPNDAPGYLREAGRTDLFEIEAARMELARGHDAKAKDFANRMIHDHTQSTDMLLAAASQAGVPASKPTTLDPRREALLAQLKAASSPDFDRFYLSQQLTAHQEALDLHHHYSQSGEPAALRPVAGQISQVVQQHIDMLHQLGAR